MKTGHLDHVSPGHVALILLHLVSAFVFRLPLPKPVSTKGR